MFLDRQIVLLVLFERLEDQSKIVPNRPVMKADHDENGITVHSYGGEAYTGGIDVATDGVHGFIRTDLRRYADLQSTELVIRDSDSRFYLPFLKVLTDKTISVVSGQDTRVFPGSRPQCRESKGDILIVRTIKGSRSDDPRQDSRCYFSVFKRLDER